MRATAKTIKKIKETVDDQNMLKMVLIIYGHKNLYNPNIMPVWIFPRCLFL